VVTVTLVEKLRELGLALGTRYAPLEQVVLDDEGRPTDEAKAIAVGEAGATVYQYRSSDPSYSGWEVSVREVLSRERR
jgi:hypothetical protein